MPPSNAEQDRPGPASRPAGGGDAAGVDALGLLIARTAIAVIVHDGGRILAASPAAVDRLGGPGTDIVGRSLADLVPEDARGALEEASRLAEEGRGAAAPPEIPFRRPDGSIYRAPVLASPVRFRGRSAVLMAFRDRGDSGRPAGGTPLGDLFDTLPIGLYQSTPAGRMLSANLALVRILRFPDRETLLATPVEDLYVVQDERRHWRARVEDAGFVSGVELRLRAYDGAEVIGRLSVRAQRGPDGGVELFEGAVEDVTESRQAEARFRLLFETMAQGVVFHDPDGAIISANPAAQRILGLTREELLGRTAVGAEWRTIRPDGTPWPPEERPAVVAGREGRPVRGGLMGVHNPSRDEVRWIELESIPLFRQGEDVPYQVYSMFADVTERRAAEEDLRRSQDRLSSIIRAAPLGITLSRASDGVFLEVNERFAETFGYRRDELLGESSLDLGLWDDPADRQAAVREIEASGNLRGFTVRFRTRTGSVRDVRLYTEMIAVAGELCALTLHQDVTESRRLEEQLRQAQKMDAVGRLAGGIAHDFNNLLTAIAGHVEFLLEATPPDDERRVDAEGIAASAERARRLTRQLLAFSRQQVMSPRVVDLADVVESFEPLLRRLIGAPVKLEVRHRGESCRVRVDPNQLEQVLLNLVVNARDAMPRGGRLTIETECVEIEAQPLQGGSRLVPGGRYARLAVADSGIGIDQATLSRVFEPFFTTKPAGKGTGLGLSTVFGIINQSGGYIGVESVEGEGTTFTIYLPEAEEPTARSAGPASDGPTRARRATAGTVLVVEDEEGVRSLTRRVLERAGYRVHTAATGTAALELLDAVGPVDLLLTDVVMPGLNGRELADRVLDRVPGLPVLFMSGYTADEDVREAARRAGGFLEKPFTPEQLTIMVRAALDG